MIHGVKFPPRGWGRFAPSSGDLSPIETLWADLRKQLAKREQDDLAAGVVLNTVQFRQRVSQILQSFSEPKGGKFNFFQKLLRGMPKRLAKCEANKYGPCGK